jgi:hypothetical protein
LIPSQKLHTTEEENYCDKIDEVKSKEMLLMGVDFIQLMQSSGMQLTIIKTGFNRK